MSSDLCVDIELGHTKQNGSEIHVHMEPPRNIVIYITEFNPCDDDDDARVFAFVRIWLLKIVTKGPTLDHYLLCLAIKDLLVFG